MTIRILLIDDHAVVRARLADQLIFPRGSINYYKRVQQAMGGKEHSLFRTTVPCAGINTRWRIRSAANGPAGPAGELGRESQTFQTRLTVLSLIRAPAQSQLAANLYVSRRGHLQGEAQFRRPTHRTSRAAARVRTEQQPHSRINGMIDLTIGGHMSTHIGMSRSAGIHSAP